MNTRRLRRGLAALALVAAAGPSAAQQPAPVYVEAIERTGSDVVIRIATGALASVAPSEPFHLGGGRSRLFVTLEGARIVAPVDSLVPEAGMLRLRAERVDAGVRLTTEIAGLASYHVERTATGVTLRLGLDRPQPAAAVPAAAAPDSENAAARVTGAITTALIAAGPLAARGVAAARAEPSRSLALLALALSSIAAALLVLRRGTVEPPPQATPLVQAATGRIRAARALADKGLSPADIARRTGLPRDVAALLVPQRDAADPAAAGTKFRDAARAGSGGPLARGT